MLSWIIQITIVSIILIFLVHYLFNFFKETLTVPKIKDLVNVPNKKYENMFNIISKNNEPQNTYTDIDLLPKFDDEIITKPDADSMKNELKSFFKKQLEEASNVKDTFPNMSTIGSMPNPSSHSYSDF